MIVILFVSLSLIFIFHHFLQTPAIKALAVWLLLIRKKREKTRKNIKIKGTISLEWLRLQRFSVYFLQRVFLLKQCWWCLFVCPQSVCWGCGGGGTVLRSLGGSRSLSGMEWYAKAAFLIYSVSILHDMQNKLWREGGKKVSFEWPCRLEGLIFSPSLLKILDMQMDVTVIPCHSLAGWLAVPTHSLLPVLCGVHPLSVARENVSGNGGSVLYPGRWIKKWNIAGTS